MLVVLGLGLLATTVVGSILEDPHTAIINGELATIEDFPFYALLVYADTNSVLCGGSIISIKTILTAAHCVFGDDKENIAVFVGVSSLDDIADKDAYEIQNIISHPNYDRFVPGFYDVALLELKSKIKLGTDAKIISLATGNPVIGEEITAVGFGVIECVPGTRDCVESNHLRTTTMTVRSIGIADSIKSVGEGSNVCYGDSGGPMIYDDQVVGVASTVDYAGCMTGGNTYTTTYLILDWIKKHVNEH